METKLMTASSLKEIYKAMNTPANEQLKRTLAKMLPELIKFSAGFGIRWRNGERCNLEVLDTELLHLCWLVEEKLTRMECTNYSDTLLTQHPEVATKADEFFWHFNWQQRTIALAKTLGVEIV